MPGYVIAGAALALAAALPVAWKWQIGIFRAALAVLAASLPAGIIVTAVSSLAHFTTFTGMLVLSGVVLNGCLAGLLISFFRDPDRVAPAHADVIVSPADGLVIYVREVQAGEVPEAEKKGRSYPLRELSGTTLDGVRMVAIGISMNLVNVHVNRAPMAGRATLIRHVPGTFGSLRNPQMVLSNERATTLIEADGMQVAIVQIASRLVRRIVTFIAEGDAVRLGQRIGAIRFGSQVDLLVPAEAGIRLSVQAGDQVVAGQTIVAVIASNANRADPQSARGRRQHAVNHDRAAW
jgi:phosphatidylserine decarboxylase